LVLEGNSGIPENIDMMRKAVHLTIGCERTWLSTDRRELQNRADL
jgi:hypothetical protein